MAERQCERIERYLSGDRTSARMEKRRVAFLIPVENYLSWEQFRSG